MADDKPIIIIKKKGGHGGHHGGAWKIAYADFVTAMMCFFMVMWLVNSAETATKKSIATYFRRPGIFQEGSGAPLMQGQAGILEGAPPPVGEDKGKKSPAIGQNAQFEKRSGTDEAGKDKRVTYRGEETDRPLIEAGEAEGIKTSEPGDKLSRAERKEKLEEIAEELRQQIAAVPELAQLLGIVDIKVDADGLTIEIMDTEKVSMFASGSARILPEAQAGFERISQLMSKMDNRIEILGHTDAKPYATRPNGYSNWELSTDRANAARRLLEQSGIASSKITSVVGRADQDLRNKEDPMAAANRRITLKMKFDFSKTVDLSKDPQALEKIPDYQREHSEAEAARRKQQVLEYQQRKKAEKEGEKIHSLTPKDIVESAKEKKSVPLPEERNGSTPAPSGKDKIFGESPVVGPPDLFSDL